MTILKKLSIFLSKSGLVSFAQEINELEKDWEEAAAEFGSEPISEDEYLNQIHPNAINEDINLTDENKLIFSTIAEDEGFKIVSPGSKSVRAGRGGYGIVYRGVYQGKPAVAKIIIGSEGLDEIINWKKIEKASQSIVPSLKKHLPKIYKLNYQYYKNNPMLKYGIVIMEELIPLNSHFMEKIKNPDFETISNPELLWILANKLKKDIDASFNKLKLNDASPDESNKITNYSIFEILLTIDFKGLLNNNYTSIENFLMNVHLEIKKKLLNKFSDNKATYNAIMNASTYNSLYNYLYPSLPPSGRSREGIDYFLHLPEASSFMNSLVDLADKFGLSWDDLVVPNNLMMGTDGNLKLIDPGIYEDINLLLT